MLKITAILLLSIFWNQSLCFCQGWAELATRVLPDSSFAIIEYDEIGRKVRHCPHHDMAGHSDWEQLIFVIGTFDGETWQQKKNKNLARKHLEKHYKWFRNNVMNKELKQPININGAGLTDLVALPTIGPVMAVKIIEYRNSSSHFETIEDIRNVEGIGPDMYNAIRYYIAAY